MELETFWKKYDSVWEKGQLLHVSQSYLEGTDSILKVQIFEHLILFDNWCIRYSYDLKFSIKDQTIRFQFHEAIARTMVFHFTKNDQHEWYKVLCAKLNQKGFHETFKPKKKIGKGSFATVFLVEKIETHKQYAVKAFSKQLAYGEEKGKQCLIKQIEIMRYLHHRNIMSLQEVFQSDNSLYLIFQFMQGGQLLAKVEEKYDFKQEEVQIIMRSLLEGTKEMHRQDIMHRDLKPENILFKEVGSCECAIADFGLAQFSEEEEYLFVRCGTPGYVAPEVINIKDMSTKYTTACDIFSLGAIFHLLLTKKPLFKSKKNDDMVKENRACTFSFEDKIYRDISHEALDLMKKMLRVDPEERINAEQALSHPFFKETHKNFVLPPVKKSMLQLPKQASMPPTSPSNKKPMEPIKDSCLEFKMAKENVLTGQTKTIGNMDNTKVSMFGKALIPGRISKISKFSKPPS